MSFDLVSQINNPLILTSTLGILLTLLMGAGISTLFLYHRAKNLNPLFEEREKLKKEIESEQRTIADMNARMNQLRQEEAVAQRAIAEAAEARKFLEDNADAVALLRSQIARAQDETKNVIDKLNKAEEALQEKNLELQEIAGKHQALSEEMNRYTATCNSLKSDISSLQSKIKILHSEKEKLDSGIQKLQADYSKKEIELASKKVELDTLEKRLADKKKELTEEQNAVTQLKKSKNGLYEEIEDREQDLRNLREAIIDKGPVSEENRWADLNRPYVTRRYSKTQKANEEDWIEEFKQNLKDSGIHFHDRMVHAFHTSLKVADCSPLVVLAGISGTGKSLLPQLYAHAIGMNFLQMAVQPRWDSPQDMFGFYNYMEGRYKATPLSRLLWQYDIYNNAIAREEFRKNRNIPVNMVLLDEMNLAKVEYYFSDMLSKLEVRRNINPNNPDQRREAELEIESGSIHSQDQARRLFIGNNILFVGTMNEDESTQSLSDKVIDRANVLRFGKPKSLDAKPNTEYFEELYSEADLGMTFAIWQEKWIREKDREPKVVLQFLTDINEQLGKMGRPFAYRVFNSIRAYVRNYPVQDKKGLNMALADQIEMKILPKLNGIDKESSTQIHKGFQEIGRIIDVLHDDELSNAFKTIVENRDNVFFQWTGIPR